MKTKIYAILTLLLLASPIFADGDGGGFGGFGDFGGRGFGFGGGHHGLGGFGSFGGDFGLGFFDAERTQARFEDQFDSLQTKYDEGVADDTEFFTSTLYENIVSKTERLDDRYGLFVSGVERSIDRITDLIATTNDDITYFSDLLADYQADTSLSATRLDRIEAWIGRITDRLTNRVDSLTDKQSTLQTNLPTYQTFQTDISTFLSDIEAAGGGASDGSSAVSLTSKSVFVEGSLNSDEVTCATSGTSLSPTATPEPATAALLALAAGAGYVLSARRSRGRE